VLLGQTVARSLFGDSDPVGETVRVRRVPHEVIGVLDRKGQSMIGQDQDDVVLIPISTARKRVLGGNIAKSRNVNSISVKVKDGADLAVAEQEIRDLLRQRHRLQPNQEDDFFCATSPRCSPRRRRRRACWRGCSPRSRRCRLSSAASAS